MSACAHCDRAAVFDTGTLAGLCLVHAAQNYRSANRDRPVSRTRSGRVRARTWDMGRFHRGLLAQLAAEYPPSINAEHPRPVTRADCVNGPRPCPFAGCAHHLYLDVNPRTGSVKLNYPEHDPWELPETCALDVAERGARSLTTTGHLMNLTRQRVQTMEVALLARLRALPAAVRVRDDDAA